MPFFRKDKENHTSIFSSTKKTNEESKNAILRRMEDWSRYSSRYDHDTSEKIRNIKNALRNQTDNNKANAANSDRAIRSIMDQIEDDFRNGYFGVANIRLGVMADEVEKRRNGERSDNNDSYTTDEIRLEIVIAKLENDFEKQRREYENAESELENCRLRYGEKSIDYRLQIQRFKRVKNRYVATCDILERRLRDRNRDELLELVRQQTETYRESNKDIDVEKLLSAYSELQAERTKAEETDTAVDQIEDLEEGRIFNTDTPSTQSRHGQNTYGRNNSAHSFEGVEEKIEDLEKTENSYNQKIKKINSDYLDVCDELSDMIHERKTMRKGRRAAINSDIDSLYNKKCRLYKQIGIYTQYRALTSKLLELYSTEKAIKDGAEISSVLRDEGIDISNIEDQTMQLRNELKKLEDEIAKLDSANAIIDNSIPRSKARYVGDDIAEEDDSDDKYDYMFDDPELNDPEDNDKGE